MRPLVTAVGVLSVCVAAGPVSAQTIADPTQVDVCKRVPGEDVARALGKALGSVRPGTTDSASRCVYLLKAPDRLDAAAAGVVLWLYEAEDYDALAELTEAPTEKLSGLGDAALRFRDPGDGLYKLRVVNRGRFALEAVAADPDTSRKLAELALARFSR